MGSNCKVYYSLQAYKETAFQFGNVASSFTLEDFVEGQPSFNISTFRSYKALSGNDCMPVQKGIIYMILNGPMGLYNKQWEDNDLITLYS